jgi:hypothetical protein
MRLIETFQEQSADFTQVIELDDIFVSLRIIFNIRTETWFINEYLELDTSKSLYGVKIVKSFPLLASMKTRIDLPGDFVIVKEDESIEDEITYDNLNAGWNLYYLTQDELYAWGLINGSFEVA